MAISADTPDLNFPITMCPTRTKKTALYLCAKKYRKVSK
jgi:hypothetical protein